MSEPLTHLPPSWTEILLGEICDKPEYGWTTSASQSGTHKFLRTTDISSGPIDWSSVPYCAVAPEPLGRFQLGKGDLVISRAGSVGLSALIGECPIAVFASYLIRFRPDKELETRFLAYFLQSPQYWQAIRERSAGIALQNVNARKLASISVPIAPGPEQRRIVAEIEKQFTRLDAAVAALRRVQANLKLYRAAVLKAACDGRLVPTEAELARKQGRSYETGEQLLARILKERRAKWEADQLAKMHAAGKPPSDDDWKNKYREPKPPELADNRALPEGWAWTNLGQLSWSVKDGPHYSPKYSDTGVPFITGGQVRPSGVDFAAAKYISHELHCELIQRCRPEKGDLLYTKGGTTGIARVNTYDIEFSVWVHVAVLKLVNSVAPFYVQHALNSPPCYSQSQKFTHGVGNQDLGLTRMVWIEFGLPPLSEQQRIVDEVDRRLSEIDDIEKSVETEIARADRLRQSILKRAFEGKLVPQDPNDEPASVLLERIRAERVSPSIAPKKKPGRKTVGRRPVLSGVP